MTFNSVKVFSATMMNERHTLGEKVTNWLADHPAYEIADIVVTQSSDHSFHCLAITIFYNDPMAAARLAPRRPQRG